MAYVEHSSGKKVVTASTREFAIMRHLHRFVLRTSKKLGFWLPLVACLLQQTGAINHWQAQRINQSIRYCFIVHPKVDQRAGQLCLPHLGITKTKDE